MRTPSGALLLVLMIVAAPRTATAQDSTATRVMVQDLSWSPDGGQLWFSAMRVKRDFSDFSPTKWAIYRYDLAKPAVRRMIDAAYTVAVSPRGDEVAVGKVEGKQHDLVVYGVDGTLHQWLTRDTLDDAAPSWSPDGQSIVFTSKRGGRNELWVIGRDGQGARRVIDVAPDQAYNPAWSPDGRWIAYYLEKGDHRDQIHVVHPDGTGDHNVTRDTLNNIYPGWDADGRVIYSGAAGDEMPVAFAVATGGTGKSRYEGITGFVVRPSPDGSHVAFLDRAPDGNGVRITIAMARNLLKLEVPLDKVGVGP